MNEHFRENPFLTRGSITPLPLRPDNKASSFDIGYNHLPPDLSSAPQSLWELRKERELSYSTWLHGIREQMSITPALENLKDPFTVEISHPGEFNSIRRKAAILKAIWALNMGEPKNGDDEQSMNLFVAYTQYYVDNALFIPSQDINQFPYKSPNDSYPGIDILRRYKYTGPRIENETTIPDVFIPERIFLDHFNAREAKALTNATVFGNTLVSIPSVLFNLSWIMREINNEVESMSLYIPIIGDPEVNKSFHSKIPVSTYSNYSRLGTAAYIVTTEKNGIPALIMETNRKYLYPYGLTSVIKITDRYNDINPHSNKY